jgi:hypothetical protein
VLQKLRAVTALTKLGVIGYSDITEVKFNFNSRFSRKATWVTVQPRWSVHLGLRSGVLARTPLISTLRQWKRWPRGRAW